ncbi:hypothetical protein BJAS_P3437 [Bathymodiolus japonicus methanotrophic gill symbiont]|uniref:hypothetical protein n=1 Tax=Bathymodiolus japonicus methanotrophic gill symbiont TaxID=113269 RepID=UPI001B5CB0EE|nr:hypothetical protein [Bathymodiolus japonicus methanotrophic gill symbiont]GFO72901.1 hypothetical protein BJAS_P3437 [Bathymodiolus japonicus methanotrophic gill symbiont]
MREEEKRELLLIQECMKEPNFRSLMIILLSSLRPKYRGNNVEFITASHHRNDVINLIEDKLKESPLDYLEMKLQQMREEHATRIREPRINTRD